MNLEKGKAVKNLLILLPMVILMVAGGDSIVEQEKQTTIVKQLSTIKPETIMLDASPIDLAEIEALYTCDIWYLMDVLFFFVWIRHKTCS